MQSQGKEKGYRILFPHSRNFGENAVRQEPLGERWPLIVFSVALICAVGYLALYFCFEDMQRLVERIPDDAFYYFGIAQNIAAGKGITFDGLHATNGFMPLWMITLTPLYALIHGSPETMARLSMILSLALLAVACGALYSWLLHTFSRLAALVGGLLFIVTVMFSAANGMESAALILALVLALRTLGSVWTGGSVSSGKAFVLGITLGLVILGRLDHVFLATAAFVALGLRFLAHPRDRAAHLRTILIAGAGVLVIVGPYLINNLVQFGGLMPISGKLKSTFPHLPDTLVVIRKFSRAKLVIAALSMVYLAALPFIRKRERPSYGISGGYRTAVAVFSAAFLLHGLWSVLFMKWDVMHWHFVGYNLLFILLIIEGAERWILPHRLARSLPAWSLLAAVLITARVTSHYRSPQMNYNGAAYETALWARAHTAPTDVFCQRDTGTFGFFSLRRTINLDGLVNNMDYQKALHQQKLAAYLKANNVRYLVFHIRDEFYESVQGNYGAYSIRYWSWAYKHWSDTLTMFQSKEVYRSHTFAWGVAPYEVCIWEL